MMRKMDIELNSILVDTYHFILKMEETQKKYTRSKLSFRDRNAMELIEGSDNGIRISDIAEFLKISKPSATSIIKKLASLGFVEKSSDGSDERTTYAKITKRGRLMCAYQRQYRNNMSSNVADTLTDEEYEGFKKGLRNLNMFFEESITHTENRGKNR